MRLRTFTFRYKFLPHTRENLFLSEEGFKNLDNGDSESASNGISVWKHRFDHQLRLESQT